MRGVKACFGLLFLTGRRAMLATFHCENQPPTICDNTISFAYFISFYWFMLLRQIVRNSKRRSSLSLTNQPPVYTNYQTMAKFLFTYCLKIIIFRVKVPRIQGCLRCGWKTTSRCQQSRWTMFPNPLSSSNISINIGLCIYRRKSSPRILNRHAYAKPSATMFKNHTERRQYALSIHSRRLGTEMCIMKPTLVI